MVNSSFVTDSELDDLINAAGAELYDLIVGVYEDHYTTSLQVTVVTGSSFPVTGSIYKLRGVDYLDGSEYVPLKRFEWRDRGSTSFGLVARPNGHSERRYRWTGATMHFIPQDDAVGTYQIWYVPRYVALSGSSATMDDLQEWTDYVVVGAAIRCLAKEESDVSVLMAEKAMLERRIKSMSSNRDADEPEVMGSRWRY